MTPNSPTSQAVTPPDEKLEKLMDELESATVKLSHGGKPIPWMANAERYDAARAALREYVSARMLTRDEMHTVLNGNPITATTRDRLIRAAWQDAPQ